MHVPGPDMGYSAIRVTHRKEHLKGRGKVSARYKVKCGCCNEFVEISYDETGLEINGVNGSIENWREILLPLLKIRKVIGGFEDISNKAENARGILRRLRKKYPKYPLVCKAE
jgi:hypothetical protein